MPRETGTVVRIVRDRGFMFIRSHVDNTDIFAHLSAFNRAPGFSFDHIEVGDAVEFDRASGPRGSRAESLDPAPATSDPAAPGLSRSPAARPSAPSVPRRHSRSRVIDSEEEPG